MMSMQEKILELIEVEVSRASEGKVEVVKTHTYSNVGTLYLQTGIETYAIVDFTFNASYCGLKVTQSSDLVDLRDVVKTEHPNNVGKVSVQFHALRYEQKDKLAAVLAAVHAIAAAAAAGETDDA